MQVLSHTFTTSLHSHLGHCGICRTVTPFYLFPPRTRRPPGYSNSPRQRAAMLPAGHRPATSSVHYTTSCNTQSSAPDGQNNCPKHVELTGIINKPLLLHLVGCLYYLYFVFFLYLLKNLNLTLILKTWRIC